MTIATNPKVNAVATMKAMAYSGFPASSLVHLYMASGVGAVSLPLVGSIEGAATQFGKGMVNGPAKTQILKGIDSMRSQVPKGKRSSPKDFALIKRLDAEAASENHSAIDKAGASYDSVVHGISDESTIANHLTNLADLGLGKDTHFPSNPKTLSEADHQRRDKDWNNAIARQRKEQSTSPRAARIRKKMSKSKFYNYHHGS